MNPAFASLVVDLTKDDKKCKTFKKRPILIEDDDETSQQIQSKKKSKVSASFSTEVKPLHAKPMIQKNFPASQDRMQMKKKCCERILGKPAPQTTESKERKFIKVNEDGRGVLIQRLSVSEKNSVQKPSIPKKSVKPGCESPKEDDHGCEPKHGKSYIQDGEKSKKASNFASPTCSVWLNTKQSCSGSLLQSKGEKVVGPTTTDSASASTQQSLKALKPDSVKLDAKSVGELLDLLQEDIKKAMVVQPTNPTKTPEKKQACQKQSLKQESLGSKQHGRLDEIHSLINMLMSSPQSFSVESKNKTKPSSERTISSEELLGMLMKKK